MDQPPPASPGGVAGVATLAGELYAQRRWPRVKTIRVLDAAMAAGHTWAEVELVMRRVAADPTTDGPGRLMAPGLPPDYWTVAAAELRPPRPPWCGHPDCHEDTRHRVVEIGGNPRGVKCPTCHPDVATASTRGGPA